MVDNSGRLTRITATFQNFRRFIVKQGLRYWIAAIVVLLASIASTPYVDSYFRLVQIRYWLFQHLGQSRINPAEQRFVKLVMIRDDDFWDGPLEHRLPTNRLYLKQIVDGLDAPDVDADLIALDFDLRLPDPQAAVNPGQFGVLAHDYRAETDELVRSIIKAAEHGRKVILAKTLTQLPNGDYRMSADAYQVYGLCTKLVGDGRWQNPGLPPTFTLTDDAKPNITCGYIGLTRDMRQIPPMLNVAEQGHLDSFSLAIVRATDPQLASRIGTTTAYATYIVQKDLDDRVVSVSAHDLLARHPQALKTLLRKPVIVGAEWNEHAKGIGPLHDLHSTPIGDLSGAFIHENFAEAVHSGRLFVPLPQWGVHVLEVFFGLIAAVLLAVWSEIWIKFAIVVSLCVFLVFLQWVSLLLFGTFFEAFLPVLGLGLHSIGSRLLE